MTRRIVIVGNAKPQVDVSKFVDTSDIVVRFNACGYYGQGHTGNKADILCLAGGLHSAIKFIQSGLNPHVVENIHTVLFKREDFGELNRLITIKCNLEKKEAQVISMTFLKDLLSELSPPPDVGAPYEDMMVHNDPFYNPTTGLQVIPSYGITAIAHFVKSPEYEDYEIWVVCFTWEGVIHHPWAQEKLLCQSYVKAGRLNILPIDSSPPIIS